MTVTVYSEVADLTIGSLVVPDPNVKLTYLVSAAREINARLGGMYVTPIDTSRLEPYATDLLAMISSRIASGRLIMSLAIAGEDGQVNPYGRMLVQEGIALLEDIATGRQALAGAELVNGRSGENSATIINRDEASAVEAFENAFMRDPSTSYTGWRPGAA